MRHRTPRRVEDYTTASLMLILINLLWMFLLIWALFGLLAVILTGWVLNQLITWLQTYRARREIRWPSDA
ncbi:histidinol phosphate aminotransferase [Marivita sp. S2033]|uniref:histidinol phosphate aminotransferase n=1 Tax=Marivita sp. S2033 TaxID=3373187 RepID=UPI0039827A06